MDRGSDLIGDGQSGLESPGPKLASELSHSETLYEVRPFVKGVSLTVTLPEKKLVSENFKSYEEGKQRRYNLLFAVNGGAFAIAKLFAEKNAAAVLGHLSLRQLSIGMIVLTVVMVVDIFMFGEKMRTAYLPDAFGWQGKTVLVLIGTLICVGWFLVA